MKKKLTIIAGISGSGKSALAGALHSTGALVINTDSFLIDESGTYVWSSQRLSEAISQSNDAFHSALAAGHPWVVLDNTNLKPSLIKESAEAGALAGYDVELCLFAKTDDINFYSRNVHSVPTETIKRQMLQWDSLRAMLGQPDIVHKNPVGGLDLLFWYKVDL